MAQSPKPGRDERQKRSRANAGKAAASSGRRKSTSSRKPASGASGRGRRASRGALSSSTGILVLGMHRSGTSVLTRGLKALGVYLGDSLLGPEPDNPKGYWEHRETFAINEQVMAVLDRPWWSSRPITPERWQRRDLDELKARAASLLVNLFRGRRLWGFKDPRTIRLFPFWRDVLDHLGPSVSIVLAIRPPHSAIGSLVARDGMPAADAEELWLEYMLPWLPEIAKYPAAVVDYDRLIGAPLRQLRRVAKHLGVTVDPADPEITEYTRSFVDRGLRHHVLPAAQTSADDVQPSLADQAYGELLKLTRSRASWRRCLELARHYRAATLAQPGHKRAQGSSRSRGGSRREGRSR
jgi:hypothetical protein